MGQSALTNPVVVYRSGQSVLLVSAKKIDDPMADCQTWHPRDGYSEVKPLGVWLKFLYYLEEVTPPEKWVEPA